MSLLLGPNVALAYVGPGMGAGAIAVVIGIVSSIFFALVGIVYYPIKRAIRKRKAQAEHVDQSDEGETAELADS